MGHTLPKRTLPNLANGSTAGNTTLLHHSRKSVVIAQSSVGDQAPLISHSGPGASVVLLGCPTSCEFQLQPETFRMLTLERLRLPIHGVCGAPLDLLGRHRGACPRSGRLKSRAVPTERRLARACREVGAVVRSNVKPRDNNVVVPVEDERAIEVLASGLPMLHGTHLAVDITLRNATSSDGWPQPNVAHRNGSSPQPSQEGQGDQIHGLWLATGVAWLSLRWRQGADGVTRLSSLSTCWLEHPHRKLCLSFVGPYIWRGDVGGCACWRFRARGLSPILWCNLVWRRGAALTGPRQIWRTCSGKPEVDGWTASMSLD